MKNAAAVDPIPNGYHTVTPYLMVRGASQLIEFLQHAFKAEVKTRHDLPNGNVANAEVKIGTSMVLVADAREGAQAMPAAIYLYVSDVDSWYQQAVSAGAQSLMEPADQFYGDRNAGVQDPAGNQWWIATHIEDVSEAELQRRMIALRKS